RGPARSHLRKAQAGQLLPAPRVAPYAAAQPFERSAGVAEHAFERRRATHRALAGRDRDADFLERAEARREMIEHGSRERRKRARTRERETSGRARLAVHLCAEARNERATVGDVDVMRARGKR